MWRLRKTLFSHIIVQEVGFFDKVRTGELMNRLSEVSASQLHSLATFLSVHVSCAFALLSMQLQSLDLLQDTRLMKSAGTISISIALRSIAVASFGLVLMFMTSPLLSALTLGGCPSSWTWTGWSCKVLIRLVVG